MLSALLALNRSRRAKRVVDVVVASSGLATLSPLLLALTALELHFHGWPPLFTQNRPGLHGRIFRMVKFRSMKNAVGADGTPLPDAERLTRFGEFLRRASLDELPELWNVLRGEMSLVGPRPLLVEYLPLYSERQARRHDVKPGITGWAQVNGRNALSWEEKFEHDLFYVENGSLTLDAKILFLTAWKVVRRDGISKEGEATMTRFEGSPETQS